MKRPLLYFLVLCFLQFQFNDSKAQNWNWAKSFGDSNINVLIKSICKNNNDEFVVAGLFEGSNLNLGLDTLIAKEYSEVFISLVDNLGNFKWSTSFGGLDFEKITNTFSDKYGNIYISGNYSSLSIKIGYDTLFNKGMEDGFLVKINNNGNFEWALNIGSKFNDRITGSVVDSMGNIYLSGQTENDEEAPFSIETFLIKINPNKNIEWIKMGTANEGTFITTDLIIDENQILYIVGATNGKVLFENKYLIESDSNYSLYRPFIVEYDISGKFITSRLFYDVEFISSISYSNNSFFYSGIKSYLIEYEGYQYYGYNFEINKTNKNFEKIWTKSVYPLYSTGNDYVKKIVADESGGCYVSGRYIADSIYFNTDTLVNLKYKEKLFSNSFLVKYDSSGNEIWLKNIGGELDDEIEDMILTKDNKLLISGSFSSPILQFGDYILENNCKLYEFTHGTSTFFMKFSNAFIASLSDINTRIKENQKVSDFLLYPNPTQDYFNIKSEISNGFKTEVNIYSIDGQLAKSVSISPDSNKIYIDIDDLMPGIYIVQLKVGNQIAYQRLVKQ
jgi:hypothetical protein